MFAYSKEAKPIPMRHIKKRTKNPALDNRYFVNALFNDTFLIINKPTQSNAGSKIKDLYLKYFTP